MNELSIRTVIDGHTVSPEEVAAWERTRLPRAARKIGLPAPDGSLDEQRRSFTDAKLALGVEEMRHRLRRDLLVSDAIAWSSSYLPGSGARTSVCDLHVKTGSAAKFVQWFSDTERPDYAYTMLAANPDHFLIDTAPDGTQEVIETTGGSPAATHFFVDYTDTTGLSSSRDPIFTLELAGVARQTNGRGSGGVRHQFRDEPDGFHARLLVEFPRMTPTRLITQHQWHLACEFGNWVRFAFTR